MQLSVPDKCILAATVLGIVWVGLFLVFMDGKCVRCGSQKPPVEETMAPYHDGEDDEPEYDAYTRHGGYSTYQEGFQEGFDLFGAIRDGFDKMINGFRQIGDFFDQFFGKIKDYFDRVGLVFKTLDERFERWGHSWTGMGDGIKVGVTNVGQAIKITFDDIGDVLSSGSKCGLKFIQNLKTCAIFYFVDMLCGMARAVFLEFPIYCLYCLSGQDLDALVVQPLWNNVLEPGDAFIHSLIGYHVIHWPDWVINDCYACDVTDKVVKMKNDFTYTIPHLFEEPKNIFDKAGRDFVQLFKDDIRDHVEDDPWTGDLYHILGMDPRSTKEDVIHAYHDKLAEVQGDPQRTFKLNAEYKLWNEVQTWDVKPAPLTATKSYLSFGSGGS